MAFTPEDGTGLEAANAYVTVAFADDHHADRGRAAWAALTNTVKEQSIVRATDYIDKRFGEKFRGFKQSLNQGLEWPRLAAFDDDDYLFNSIDDVPRQLQKATAEYALIAAQLGELLPIPARPFSTIDPTTGEVVTNASGQVIYKREKVDVIEEELRFSDLTKSTVTTPDGASSTITADYNLPAYPVADEWLKELLKVGFAVNLRLGN